MLKKVVAQDPDNYAAWFDLGFLYNAQGKTDDSIAAYRKSVAAKPGVFESNLNLGLMLVKAHQPDAEQFLRAATKLKPTAQVAEGQARAWLSLGHLLETSNPDGAIEAYKQAALLDPKDPEPHLSAGPILESQNRFADAEQEYKQAFAIDPSSTDALTGMANIYMRGHRYTEAEEILRKLVALHPNDAGAHMQLGRMLAADGQNEPAIAELQVALKLAPSDPSLQLDLADLYANAKKYDLAEAQYRSLLAAKPNDPDLRYGLGRVLLKQHKFPEAQQELLAALQLKPGMGTAYGDLAAAANENKNYELVIKALDARAKLLPELPIGYFLRATAYDHLRAIQAGSGELPSLPRNSDGELSRPGMAGSPSPDHDRAQKITHDAHSGIDSRASGCGFSGRLRWRCAPHFAAKDESLDQLIARAEVRPPGRPPGSLPRNRPPEGRSSRQALSRRQRGGGQCRPAAMW